MKVRGRPGFSIHLIKKAIPPRWRVCWREGDAQDQRNRIVYTIEEGYNLIDSLAPKVLVQRIAESTVAPPPICLFDELKNYPLRMARDRRQRKSKHIKRTVSYLQRFFTRIKMFYLGDVSVEALDRYVATTTDSQTSVSAEICRLTTFLGRLAEKDIPIPTSLLSYKAVKPKAKHKFTPWSADEDAQFVAYLLPGIEVLAMAEPSWDWYERIRRICHTAEFRTRMLALALYFGIARNLTRYSELVRYRVENWNWRTKTLNLTSGDAKAEPKLSLLDDESAWLLDVLTVNRPPDALIHLAPNGGEWCTTAVGRTISRLFVAAGLDGKFPYELKYTGAGKIFDNADEFTDSKHEERVNRVRAISGHSAESKAVELYIKGKWGNTFGLGSRYFHNRHPIFPFRVADYPVLRLPESKNGGTP